MSCLTLLSYGCTWEFAKHSFKKLESSWAIALAVSYASFLLSNLPRASITQ